MAPAVALAPIHNDLGELEQMRTRIPYDLRELLSDGVLIDADPAQIGDLSCLDSSFEPIHAEPVDLCKIVAVKGLGLDACKRCPVRERALQDRSLVVQDRCAAGIWKTVAPVVVQGDTIGWTSAPQQPDPGFRSHDFSMLSEQWRSVIAQRLEHPLDLETSKAEVVDRAETLARTCITLRREHILRDATRLLNNAQRKDEVTSILFRAILGLFGTDTELILCKNRTGSSPAVNELIRTHGKHVMTEASELPAGQGHIGKVIANRHCRYDPHLSRDDPDYVNSSGERLPISVWTAPLQWGVSTAALQARSGRQDAFPQENRDAAELLLYRAGNVLTRLCDNEPLRAAMTSHLKAPWDEFLVTLLLRRDLDPFDLLAARHSLYGRYTNEIFLSAGPRCISASLRVLIANSELLGYVACEGSCWTQEKTDTLYRDGDKDLSLGWGALKSSDALYIRDTKLALYRNLVPHTRSAWAKSVSVHGEPRIVITVSWDCIDGGSPEVRENMERLTAQFEDVLRILGSREGALLSELENPFASVTDIQEARTTALCAPADHIS